ncbi:MAG: hypothetical protein BMS9Abin05_1993 [Rhodothermia bacterium]|nr:MAG: hypothetical protein BMS9Abin05_1993 [Rhodothermia bacterium]
MSPHSALAQPNDPVNPRDKEILLEIFNTNGGSTWNGGTINWDPGLWVKDWTGVFVENNRVVWLTLPGAGMTGSIPASIGELDALQRFQLPNNSLSGPLPPSINDLVELIFLDLGVNNLSGTIPAINQLIKLESVFLGGNEFEGTLPDISGLQLLRGASFERNMLDEIPTLSNLDALNLISLEENRFTFEDFERNMPLFNQIPTIIFLTPQANVKAVDNGSGTFSVAVGGANNIYEWFEDDPNTPFLDQIQVPDGNSNAFTPVKSGDYYVRVTNSVLATLAPKIGPVEIFSDVISVEVQPFCPTSGWEPRVDLNDSLPASIRVFEDCSIPAWLIRANPSSGEFSFRALPPPQRTVSSFASASNAYVAINGGFFFGSNNLSLIASGGAVLKPNVLKISRNGNQYFPTRSTFGFNNVNIPDFRWTYHVRNADLTRTLYSYTEPTQNTPTSRQSQPTAEFPGGAKIWRLNEGIGGGPMLVMDGVSKVETAWEYEVFFGGTPQENPPIGLVTTPDPRTAIGMTDSGELLFIVADGRCADGSTTDPCADGLQRRPGVSHADMAQMMIAAGAKKAMNLDGGGSSTLVVKAAGKHTVVNRPSDGSERSVMTAIALVPFSTASAATFDSDDACCYTEFGSWTGAPEGPYYGSTPARRNEVGTGDDRAVWRFPSIEQGRYEVAAWWVPGDDRATNTPYTIFQQGVGKKSSTIRVDQTDLSTEARWNILGVFDLAPGDSIMISDDAVGNTSPSYVVADAVRLVDATITGIDEFESELIPATFKLEQSYPNPFSSRTVISYSLETEGLVTLSIYNLLGELMETLVAKIQPAGHYTRIFDASRLASGVYYYRLSVGEVMRTRKMVFLK